PVIIGAGLDAATPDWVGFHLAEAVNYFLPGVRHHDDLPIGNSHQLSRVRRFGILPGFLIDLPSQAFVGPRCRIALHCDRPPAQGQGAEWTADSCLSAGSTWSRPLPVWRGSVVARAHAEEVDLSALVPRDDVPAVRRTGRGTELAREAREQIPG